MAIRIVSGSHKNRSLKVPKDGSVIRPALAQVREAIFSSLGDITGKTVCDVFAGTGSLGFEALSRGADFCHFVDGHDLAIRLLIENTTMLGFSDVVRVYKRRLPQGLKSIKIPPCDIVFCDPPYDKNLVNVTLEAILKAGILKKGGSVWVEHTRREIPENPYLRVLKTRVFGQTFVTTLIEVENS